MSFPSDLFSVADRVALVTGASSGIGAYIAQGLARAGAARVYISGRRAAQLDAVAKDLVLIPLVGDVSTIEGCRNLADAFVAAECEAGVNEVKLDLSVNNAGLGVQEGDWKQSASASDGDWTKVFAVNVSSLQWVSATLLPYLVNVFKDRGKKEGRGCIINNTSVSAFFVSPQVKGHIYAASKAAAESMTPNVASKFTRLGVRVNSIAPANVPSELNGPDDPHSFISAMKDVIPIGRIGNEEDMVGAVIYLANLKGRELHL